MAKDQKNHICSELFSLLCWPDYTVFVTLNSNTFLCVLYCNCHILYHFILMYFYLLYINLRSDSVFSWREGSWDCFWSHWMCDWSFSMHNSFHGHRSNWFRHGFKCFLQDTEFTLYLPIFHSVLPVSLLKMWPLRRGGLQILRKIGPNKKNLELFDSEWMMMLYLYVIIFICFIW